MSGRPETPEERRRREYQTKFGIQGETSRQTRLFEGERTLGGGLYVPAEVPKAPPREAAPKVLQPPGPRVAEYGAGGLERPAPVTIPGGAGPPPGPQQFIGAGPVGRAPPPEQFVVQPIPSDVTGRWHLPAGFKLYDYQETALRLLLNRHKGTVVLPTGVGKTAIAIAAITQLRVPTIVVLPTLVLVDQWRNMLLTWGIQAGEWTGVRKQPSYVTLSTYQSLYADPMLVRKFPFIVFDEAHRATAEDFRALIHEVPQHPYALALTATPPSGMGRMDLLSQILPVLVSQKPKEAIEAGQLTPTRVVPEPSSLNPQERTDYDKLTQTLRNASRRLGTGNPARIQQLLRDMQLHGAAVAFLRALSQRRALLSHVASKNATLLRILRQHSRERVLLFSESVDAIEATCQFLRANGVGCYTITGGTDERQRRYILENWGRSFYVLGSVKVLELGFNVPEVGVAVFLASGTGRLQLTQRLGRILRLAPGKVEAVAYVVYAPDTSETRVVQQLQRLAGRQVTVETKKGIEDFEED